MAKGKLKFIDNDNDRKEFAARLQTALDQSNFKSVSAAAKAAGVSQQAFHNWLKAEAEPARDRLVVISEILEVDIAWLITGKVSTPTPDQAATPVVDSGDPHAGYQDEPPFNSAVMEKVTEAFLDWQDANPIENPAPNSHQGQALTGTYRVIMKEFVREGRIDLDAIKGRVTTIFDYLLEND